MIYLNYNFLQQIKHKLHLKSSQYFFKDYYEMLDFSTSDDELCNLHVESTAKLDIVIFPVLKRYLAADSLHIICEEFLLMNMRSDYIINKCTCHEKPEKTIYMVNQNVLMMQNDFKDVKK